MKHFEKKIDREARGPEERLGGLTGTRDRCFRTQFKLTQENAWKKRAFNPSF